MWKQELPPPLTLSSLGQCPQGEGWAESVWKVGNGPLEGNMPQESPRNGAPNDRNNHHSKYNSGGTLQDSRKEEHY